jgi:antitoxin YefM
MVFSRDGRLVMVEDSCTLGQKKSMPRETTYTRLRENPASVLDEVVDQQETVIVRRKGGRDVALVPASELAGLLETAHLLRSPRNAKRLMSALRRSTAGGVQPRAAKDLRQEMLGAATE